MKRISAGEEGRIEAERPGESKSKSAETEEEEEEKDLRGRRSGCKVVRTGDSEKRARVSAHPAGDARARERNLGATPDGKSEYSFPARVREGGRKREDRDKEGSARAKTLERAKERPEREKERR